MGCHLKELGGEWSAASINQATVDFLTHHGFEDAKLVTGSHLRYAEHAFDLVVLMGVLEDMPHDVELIEQCHRVLTSAGRLVVHVSHAKTWGLVPRKRRITMRAKGVQKVHMGYRPSQLFDILKDGFDVEEFRTHCRFFLTSMDAMTRLIIRRMLRDAQQDVELTAVDVDDEVKRGKVDRFCSWMYPLGRLAGWLDGLLFFTSGYVLIACARRRIWKPRLAPRLKDGRSIADAALNTKIGTAAPF